MVRFTSSLAIGLLLACAAIARADDGDVPGPSEMEAGVFAGAWLSNFNHQFYDDHTLSDREGIRNSPEIGLRYAYFPHRLVGVEAEGSLILASTEMSAELATIYGLRASVVAQYPGRITPFVLLGQGLAHVRSDDDVLQTDTDFPLHVGAGARFYVTDAIALRADARYLRGPSKGEPYTLNAGYGEFFVGVSFVPNTRKEPPIEPDPDNDGFRGARDACPTVAGIAPDGCPPKDADGDGIEVPDDKCPDQAETVNGFEDKDGCPEETKDSDGDGLMDLVDKCKDEPEDRDDFQDEDGCPDADNDADGLLDLADKCPLQAGPAENRGCPDTDGDGDGVPDRIDNCPTEAGTVEFRGCKTKQLITITKHQLQVMENVQFKLGKAVIQGRSRKLLDEMARVLIAHPEITKVKVEGHTDAKGTNARNLLLSQARAAAVVNYLVKKGVEPARLEPVGHGEEMPIEDNNTHAGRTANRRVEFNIVNDEHTPTPAPTPAPAPAPTK